MEIPEATEVDLTSFRKNDVVQFQKPNEDNWIKGRLVSRAGKATGQYKRWWNVEDAQTGHISATDLGSLSKIQKFESHNPTYGNPSNN